MTVMDLEADHNHPKPQHCENVPTVQVGDSSSLLRSFNEIKQAGLQDYYWHFEERAAIREYEGELSKEDADWQAMNDIFYKFMEDNDKGQESLEVNEFIKKMVR